MEFELIKKGPISDEEIIDEIKADPDKKTYLLVAHNGVARAVESYFHSMSNREYASFGIANCAIMTYEWDA